MEILAENKETKALNPATLLKKEHHYVSNPHMETLPHCPKQVEKIQKSEVLSAWQDEQALADFRW